MFSTQGYYQEKIFGIKYPLQQVQKIIPQNEIDKWIQAGKVHQIIRKNLYSQIKPDMKLITIADLIEDLIRKELPNQKNNGIAFPVGLSVNHCVAHYTPQKDTKTILKKDDLISIDFGTHYQGRICDSAFTISFNDKFQKLQQVSYNATQLGIKNLGIDAYLPDWGKEIEEYITSEEVEIDNKIYQLNPVRSLGGHSIEPWIIHSGTFLPSFNLNFPKRITEGTYAVETFISTGSGNTLEDKNEISHYLLKNYQGTNLKRLNLLQKDINNKFSSLAFTNKWFDNKDKTTLKILGEKNILNTYPPIYDEIGSYTSQYEHTIVLRENKKINISGGDDY